MGENRSEECGEMAKRRGGFSIKPRFWLLVLAVAYVFVAAAMVRDSAMLNAQRSEIAALEQQKAELKQQTEQLKDEADFAKTDEFIERQARLMGMIRPNETRYILNAGAEAGYAQGGN